jgi:hypothetical protein
VAGIAKRLSKAEHEERTEGKEETREVNDGARKAERNNNETEEE